MHADSKLILITLLIELGVAAAVDEVMPVVLAFGFNTLGLRRVEAMVTAGNQWSCNLLERHGFTREGVLRDHAFWKDEFWDQLIYSKLG